MMSRAREPFARKISLLYMRRRCKKYKYCGTSTAAMEHDEAEFGRENEFLFYSYIQMSSDRMFADEIILFHCGQCKKKRFL